MSDGLTGWEIWIEAFGKAVRDPLRIDHRAPILDYEDEHGLVYGFGSPPDAAVAVRAERHLCRVTGTIEVDVLLPQPDRCRVLCDHRPTLIGLGLGDKGLDLIDFLDGYEAISSLVDDAVRDYLSGTDLGDWRQMKPEITVSSDELTYRDSGLVLTVLVDYDAGY